MAALVLLLSEAACLTAVLAGGATGPPHGSAEPRALLQEAWWMPSKPQDQSCLADAPLGCFVVTDRDACLGSRDGRDQEELQGLKIHGEPCVWCGGEKCHDKTNAVCEPYDFLFHGQGTAFKAFAMRSSYEVAQCRDGSAMLPRTATAPPPGVGRAKTDESCLRPEAFGCHVIRHQLNCLASKDGRDALQWQGLLIHDQPCAWCGGLACHSGGNNLCEPLDFLLHGEGLAFTTLYARSVLQVAECENGRPLPPTTSTMPPLGTLAPWWLPKDVSAENMACLRDHEQGCSDIREMGLCLRSRDGRQAPSWDGLRISGEPCVWCGGGPCHANSDALCEPFDFVMHGEGSAFPVFHAKSSFTVAGCVKHEEIPPPTDTSCLKAAPDGCHTLTDAAACLSSLDGRPEERIFGLKVHNQSCVWCGGVPCRSGSDSLCDPFDFVVNGQGQAFQFFHASGSYSIAACKNDRPTAVSLRGYTDTVPGYLSNPGGPAPLVPFWVAQKPNQEQMSCLRPHVDGCSAIKDMATCMTSRDGRNISQQQGLRINNEPCVWCGGVECVSGTSTFCEPFDYVMYGEGVAFTGFFAKGFYKVARCEEKGVERPDYRYDCLRSDNSGCPSIWNAKTCLSSKDGRSTASMGMLHLQGEPCIWCGGGACHSGGDNLCEAFDYAVNGEGTAFTTFHARDVYRVAACNNGTPTAATLESFTNFVPGYTEPLPTRTPWWIPPRPAEENLTCLSYHEQGCQAITEMGTCLSSRDGRAVPSINGLKIHGEPCVWCGGGACHSRSANKCEPFDYLMRGEGVSFVTFHAVASFSVASCAGGVPLPATNFTCLSYDNSGCKAIKDAATCLSSRDGGTAAKLHGFQVRGQPCVWCGGGPCHSGGTNLCEAFDYAVNGEGRAFVSFHAKFNFRFAGCKDGRPAAMTRSGYAQWVSGYVPPIGPAPLVPYWVPKEPAEVDLHCLKAYPDGCSAIENMGTCMSSRDGSSVPSVKGLRVSGEPCVWCGGGICHDGGFTFCEPFDFVMHGEGVVFSIFNAKNTFSVATCQRNVEKPPFDFSCLRQAASGCDALTDPYACLGSRDGRFDAEVHGLRVGGEPCVWCGGGLCHSGSSHMCEPFDYVMNGEGRAFLNFDAKLNYRIAACQGGQPRGATLDGFRDFTPGALPTIAPHWWVPPRPTEAEMSCLMNHTFGCYVISKADVCLGSRDNRNLNESKGLKIRGEPCVWCGGIPCQSDSSSLCEPFDYLMHGEGKAFSSFTAKSHFSVAKCEGGQPLPQQVSWHFAPAPGTVASWATAEGGGMPLPRAPQGPVGATLQAVEQPPNTGLGVGVEGTTPPQLHSPTVAGAGRQETDPLQQGATANSPAWASQQELGVGTEAISAAATSDEVPSTTAQRDVGVPRAPTTSTGSPQITAPPLVLPTLAPLPDVLAKKGEDCWFKCGEKGGACHFCGAGKACCRKDWAENPPECSGVVEYTTWHHECVVNELSGLTDNMVQAAMTTTRPPTPEAQAAPGTTTTPYPTPLVITTSMPPSTAGPLRVRSSSTQPWGAAFDQQGTTLATTTTTTSAPEEGFPFVLVWLLAVAFFLLCCIFAFGVYVQGSSDPIKKQQQTRKAKRLIRKDSPGEPDTSTSPEMEMQAPLVARESESESSATAGSPDMFDILDANHDGVISASEWSRGFGIFGMGPPVLTLPTDQRRASFVPELAPSSNRSSVAGLPPLSASSTSVPTLAPASTRRSSVGIPLSPRGSTPVLVPTRARPQPQRPSGLVLVAPGRTPALVQPQGWPRRSQ